MHVARLLGEEVVDARTIWGPAVGRACVRLAEAERPAEESVDLRRVQERVPETSHVCSAGVVQEDKQHIRPLTRDYRRPPPIVVAPLL
eukprot:scaffold262615_cov27-Tisochrysis_lutea.AAC.5